MSKLLMENGIKGEEEIILYLASSNSGNNLSVSNWKNVGGLAEIKETLSHSNKD